MGKVSKKNVVPSIKFSSEHMTRVAMPKYNGFKCGYGVHGKTKYDRGADKKILRAELDNYLMGK